MSARACSGHNRTADTAKEDFAIYPRNATTPERIHIGPVVQTSDGSVQTSGVSVAVRPQGGDETAGGGTISYGTLSGSVYYTPTQEETDHTSFSVIAHKSGCIPAGVIVVTTASDIAGYVEINDVTFPDNFALLAINSAGGVAANADFNTPILTLSASSRLVDADGNQITTLTVGQILAALFVDLLGDRSGVGSRTITAALTGTADCAVTAERVSQSAIQVTITVPTVGSV